MALSAVDVKNLKEAPPVEGVLPIFHQRWSARSFADHDVNPAELRKVFEAARWAASSNNEQPWRFIVGTRNSLTHQKIFESLVGFNKSWADTAPVLILGVAASKFTQSGAANSYALYDLGAAASYLTLQAAALGLTTHQMAGFDHDALGIGIVKPAQSSFAVSPQAEKTNSPNGLRDRTESSRSISCSLASASGSPW